MNNVKKIFFQKVFARQEKSFDVGILSFNINTDTANYGAALHSYAFQKYLETLNINNVIINYYPQNVKFRNHFKKIKELVKNKRYKEIVFYLKYMFLLKIKLRKILSFFKKNCTITKHRYDVKTLIFLKKINRFVCETDVTWHKFSKGYDRGFMCDLENMKYKPNIAYSIDFGSKDINDKNAKQLQEFAKNFKYISIRNIFKLDYFKNIIQRDDVVLTIDPVFLLKSQEWQKIIKAPLEENFIFVYNCKENDYNMLKQAKKYAKEKKKKIVIINSCDKFIADYRTYNFSLHGIEEFLGYIEKADCIFTNSYHGICFSIIFKKQFICFDRQGNNDKIATLLQLFDLYTQLYDENKNIVDIDYKKVFEKLHMYVADSKKFIEQSLCV